MSFILSCCDYIVAGVFFGYNCVAIMLGCGLHSYLSVVMLLVGHYCVVIVFRGYYCVVIVRMWFRMLKSVVVLIQEE